MFAGLLAYHYLLLPLLKTAETTFYPGGGEYTEKEGKELISITKTEAFAMREAGYGKHVHHTYSRYKKYYLTEDSRALKALNKYRQSHIIKVVQ